MNVTRERVPSSKIKRVYKPIILETGSQKNNIRAPSISTTLPTLNFDTQSSLSTLENEYEGPTVNSITILNDSIDKPATHLPMTARTDVRNLSSIQSMKRLHHNNSSTSIDKRIQEEKNPQTNRPISSTKTPRLTKTIQSLSKNLLMNETIGYIKHDNPNKVLRPKTVEERARYAREQIEEVVKSGLGVDEMDSQLKMCFTYLNILSDKTYSKYMIMPETEKEIMTTLTEAEIYLLKLLKNVKKTLFKHSVSQQNLVLQQDKHKKEINKLQTELEDCRNEIGALQLQITKKDQIIQNMSQAPKAPENIWTIEKLKLEAQIERMTQEIRKLQEVEDSHEELKATIPALMAEDPRINTLAEEIDEKDRKLFGMRAVLALADVKNHDSRAELQQMTDKYNDLEKQFRALEKDLSEAKERESTFRELAFMSQEDILGKDLNYKKLHQHSQNLMKKCVEAQKRLGRTRLEQVEVNAMTVTNEKSRALFEVARGVINSKDHTKRPILRQLSMENSFDRRNSKDDQRNIPLDKLCLYKPTFYGLIEDEYNQFKDLVDIDPEDNLYPLNRTYLAIIRGILDSKYNEFLYFDNPRQMSSFPEFVYSWFNTFYICPVRKNVQTIDTNNKEDAQKRRVGLYKFLTDPKLERTWDVALFKDFLDEKYSSDEIFFYLHCRYQIFRSPQLSNLAGALTPIHWVRLTICENVLKHMFKNMEEEQYESLLASFKERVREKKKKTFVDSSLVLKVLLETYRQEKRSKLENIRESFVKVAYEGLNRFEVSFADFKDIMDLHYPASSEVEKLRLYREAWCIGNGALDFKTFTIAASESNFFLSMLKTEMIAEMPFVNEASENESQVSEKIKQVKDFIESNYKQFLDAISKTQDWAATLGIESLIREMNYLVKSMNLSSTGSHEVYNLHEVYSNFTKLTQLASAVQRYYALIQNNTVDCLDGLVKYEIQAFGNLTKYTELSSDIELAKNFEKNLKVKKFQNFFKYKKSNWYSLIALLKA